MTRLLIIVIWPSPLIRITLKVFIGEVLLENKKQKFYNLKMVLSIKAYSNNIKNQSKIFKSYV